MKRKWYPLEQKRRLLYLQSKSNIKKMTMTMMAGKSKKMSQYKHLNRNNQSRNKSIHHRNKSTNKFSNNNKSLVLKLFKISVIPNKKERIPIRNY